MSMNISLLHFIDSITTRYLHDYQEPQPIEQIVKAICDYKQAYTQFGGLRPFGVAFLFAGWDKNYGFQLYQSDPSGNYSGWKATVIGIYLYTYKCYQRLYLCVCSCYIAYISLLPHFIYCHSYETFMS
jgi:hypothetical protein